jgi:HD-GYP domain-containing protein (c-di-GMP phosphodiesterase class II)
VARLVRSSHERWDGELRRHAGTQFEPRVVEAPCAHLEDETGGKAEPPAAPFAAVPSTVS